MSGHLDIITSSHVAAVLILPAVAREHVLNDAEREHWSVRDIKQRVVELRRTGGERRGRPSITKAQRTLTQLSGSVRELEEAIAQVRTSLSSDEPTREAVGSIAAALSRHLESLESWLTPPVPSSRRGNLVRINQAVSHSQETVEGRGAVVSRFQVTDRATDRSGGAEAVGE